MTLKLLTEHHFEFLRITGGCTDSTESIRVKMPHCWKSHVTAQLLVYSQLNRTVISGSILKWPHSSHCLGIVESNSFLSTTAYASFNFREKFTWTSLEDVIYLITCKKCNIQRVRQTQQKCSQRMNKH